MTDHSTSNPPLMSVSELGASAPVEAAAVPAERQPRYWVNALLFALTVVTVFYVGAGHAVRPGEEELIRPILGGWMVAMPLPMLLRGWLFAVPLLSILLAHEFGHYIAARFHRVPASLPYFIPIPNLLGTMGAVIAMRGRIKSRRALMDIGAAGPLAGLAVAIPVLLWGLMLSDVRPVSSGSLQEGQCLLYWLLKWIAVGPIPAGHDVYLHPVAFAGWAGLFVTMINLLPVMQLDGGHIAYALFGKVQNKLSRIVHWSLLGLFGLNVAINALPLMGGSGTGEGYEDVALNSMFWLVWFVVLKVLGRFGGADHPPTEGGQRLGTVRIAVGVVSLVLFVLLFMPTPLAKT